MFLNIFDFLSLEDKLYPSPVCLQLSMGDSHQSCNEEVPKPNEP